MNGIDRNITGTRQAGILLHPTSLPGGRISDAARAWLDFLADSGIALWQVLPIGVPQAGGSPYLCDSAFAINPALFDDSDAAPADETALSRFKTAQRWWLEDYCQFAVLKKHFDNAPWFDWPAPLRDRQPEALAAFCDQHRAAIDAVAAQQCKLFTRWAEVRHEANRRGIAIFGDMPIFVAHDSADVWAHRAYFKLNDAGQPDVVAGVPPDYFSETGQRWGNPQYDWEALQSAGFDWWVERLKIHFSWFDLVRIDHFRGLESVWEIDAACPTAVEGHWSKVPGAALLQTFREQMGDMPLVAEDLGVITPEVNALREQFGLPGMAVLQFSFDAFEDNPHKPENMTPATVAYTGTHDNDTTRGWFDSLDEGTQAHVMQRLGTDDPSQVTDSMIATALNSRANLAVIPLQDLLGLGSEARMNTPGTTENNWQWQVNAADLTTELAAHIRQRVADSGRLIS
ncbi:4-alpha-glucanotransferase [Granulosicoccaceae sp. 1_MG-2023]|nr:4-alpha-glucanotransferase [Granulosicoccaceae sp. 1_MG-2023]